MKHYLQKTGVSLLGLLLLAGCTDDNYDLSDIDTTSEFKINDLVIPLNLRPVTLENVLDIKDDPDAVIQVDEQNGQKFYVAQKGGNLHAVPGMVNQIRTSVPQISSINQTLNGQIENAGAQLPGVRKAATDGLTIVFPLKEQMTSFAYNVTNVSKEIFTLSEIKLENSSEQRTTIRINVSSPEISSVASRVVLRDVQFQFPRSLQIEYPSGYTYNNGLLTLPEMVADASNNFTASAEVVVTGLKFDTPLQLKNPDDYEAYGNFNINENLGIKGARLYATPKAQISEIPTSISLNIDFAMNEMVINEFSGKIRYNVNIDDISELYLSDIPDFLAGEQTNISLYNPRIELDVNNPVGNYNVGVSTGLTITTGRDNQTTSDKFVFPGFSIGHNGEGPYHIEIGAKTPDNPSAYQYSFPELSNVLSGAGIPKSLKFDLTSPKYPVPVISGDARNFPLGKQLSEIDGKYKFYSPLALCDGSVVYYTDREDDWQEEDLQKAKVTKLTLTATALSDLPCSVALTATLLDKDGNRLAKKETDANWAFIPANATAETGKFSFDLIPADPNVPFQNIDGVEFVAKATQEVDGVALSPDQKITIDNIKITVSGSYTTDF